MVEREQVCVRLDVEVVEAIDILAKAHLRSRSDMIRFLLAEALAYREEPTEEFEQMVRRTVAQVIAEIAPSVSEYVETLRPAVPATDIPRDAAGLAQLLGVSPDFAPTPVDLLPYRVMNKAEEPK